MGLRSAKGGTEPSARPRGKAGASLSQEVQAFASQLGLPAAGSTGFNETDFLPDKASRKLGSATTKGQANEKRHESAGDKLLKERQKSGKEAGPSPRQQQYNREGSKGAATVESRKWNFGAGIRPGEKAGRSLLGKDEPSLWHEMLSTDTQPSPAGGPVDEAGLEELRNEAEKALANEATIFEQNLGRNRADSRWLQQVRQAGTTADKLAAMTLLLRESPVANLRSLDELLRWVGKGSGARGVAAQAIDALKEVFITLLLPDRKLLSFEQRPLQCLGTGKEKRRRILLFYFEDAVKKRYAQFVRMLREASRDSLEFIKEKAVRAAYDLLTSKPEQEAVLLAVLVDKLGDPSRKTASHAGYLLGQLLEEHPVMGMVVVQETERFLFRPHLPARALYYATVFLNQIVLSKRPEQGGRALAKKLVDTYFTLFHLILAGKVGHAAEAQAGRLAQAEKKQGKGGKKSRKGTGERRRQAPSKAQRAGAGATAEAVSPSRERGPHWTPRAPGKRVSVQGGEVDAKLLGALLAGVRRAFPFLEAADSEALMEQHAHALFRVMHTATFGVAVQALSLLFQLLDARSSVSDRYYRALYGMLLAPDVAKGNKSAMFLSLLFKSIRVDVSERRMLAFIKRLLQVATEQLPNFACGCLLLVSEVLKARPALWAPILEPADGQLERFEDALCEDPSVRPSSAAAARPPDEMQDAAGTGAYDMSKREPLYCNAEKTCLWELVPFTGHMHPSVAVMAKTLLAGVLVDYLGDPLRDLSISSFLDKFSLKKPKAREKAGSVMQPRARISEARVATPGFAELAAAAQAPETAYFHKFYRVKAERERAGLRPQAKRKKKKKKRGPEEAPLESDDDGLPDSDADSEAMDEAMEGEEDMEDADGAEYRELAAAMAGADAEHGSEEAGSGDDDLGDGAVFSDPDASSGGREDSVGVPADASELAGPSDEESGRDSEEEEEDESGSEWVMAEGAEGLRPGRRAGGSETGEEAWASGAELPTAKRKADPEAGESKPGPSQRLGKKQKKSVFAPAREYAHLLEEVPQGPGEGRSRNPRE